MPLPLNVSTAVATGLAGNGDQWANVIGMAGNAANFTNAEDAANAIKAFYTSINADAIFGSGWTLTEIKVTAGTSSGPNPVFVFPQTLASSALSRLPGQNAIVVSWKTGLGGRSFRGRTYLGPISQAVITSAGVVSAGSRTTIQNAATALIAALDTVGMPLAVYSRKLGEATPVTSAAVGTTVDTQRRRRSAVPG
jgi:hypothetical protein